MAQLWCVLPIIFCIFTTSAVSQNSQCTIYACEGVNLLDAIKRDLEPWRERGGIFRKDVDEATSWRVHRNQFTKKTGDGWCRVTIVEGKLYVSHLGVGYGSRDGVWILALLDIMKKYSLPDVDFVLSSMDKSHVEKARWPWRDMLPFTLSFSQSPEYYDVPLPDSSFWSWPEKAIQPQWELMKDADFVWPWSKKVPLVHWRGGLARSGGLRKKLASCANESPRCTAAIDIRAAGPNTDLWEPAMGPCRFKYAVFAQGEGYTSSKHRILACGSLPIFAEYNTHDTYYGRFLEPDVHYKRIRYSLRNNATDQDDAGTCICADLDRVTAWATSHDIEAKAIGANARRFTETVLGKDMLESYIAAVLTETAKLQSKTDYDYQAVLREVHGQESFQSPSGHPITSYQDLVKRFNDVDDHLNHTETWARREAQIVTAIAAFEGQPCPRTTCTKCCGNPALRANPNRIVRSPCGKSQPVSTNECPSKSPFGLDSSDPWHRESMKSLKHQETSIATTNSYYASPTSPANQALLSSGREPAWKQWLRTKNDKPDAFGESSFSSGTGSSTPLAKRHPNGAPRQRYSRGSNIKPSGPWGNQLVTQITGSDPLAGTKRVREEHD